MNEEVICPNYAWYGDQIFVKYVICHQKIALKYKILITGFQCFSHLVIHALLRVRVGLTSLFGIHWFHIFHNANTALRALTATL